MLRRLLAPLAVFAVFAPVAFAQNKIEVRSNGLVIHQVETDARSIDMRGDGWKDLGTFATSGGDEPSGGGSGVPKIMAGQGSRVSPPDGTDDTAATNTRPGISGPPGAPGPQAPASGGTLVTTQAQFVAAVSHALANCYIVNFATGSRFIVTGRMVFTAKDCGQDPTGWNGNGLRITNEKLGVNDGGGIIVIQTGGRPNRSLNITGTAIYGGGYHGASAGDCLRFQAARDRAIYKFIIRDIWVDYCGNGLALIGDVFEGALYNVQAENNARSGIYMNHGADCGIVSNVFLFSPNLSRNKQYGMLLDTRSGCGAVSSVQAFGPSMVSNAIGGIKATGGIRLIQGGNCENSGLVCIDVDGSPYQTVIMGMEMSTDNSTNARLNGSQAAKYLLRYPAAQNARLYFPPGANSVACYGANCSGVQLRAP